MANRPCDRLLSFSVTHAIYPSSALRLSLHKDVSNLLVYPCDALDFSVHSGHMHVGMFWGLPVKHFIWNYIANF